MIIAVLFVALHAWPSLADSIETRHLQSLGEVRYHELQTESPKRRFHLFVDLPEGYADSDQHYPAVYLLDGGNTYPLLAALHHYLRFGDEAPPLLLVGISYGADTFRQGNWRQTDFTAPADSAEFWGGAGDFQALIEQRLLPLVESNYRADPAKRILFGHSLGGQFVLYSALTRPELFYGRIASSPALHRNLDFFLDRHGPSVPEPAVSRLVVTMAEFEGEELRSRTLAWRDHWRAAKTTPWTWEFMLLPGQTHFSSAPDSFRLGLQWLLEAPPPR